MRDPERLLDHGSKLEARLLASAVDEPPPPDLLGRTLDVLAKAPPLPGGSGGGTGGGTGTGAGAAAGGSAKAGGILGAAGIGAALGFLVVGGLELASLRAEPRRRGPRSPPRSHLLLLRSRPRCPPRRRRPQRLHRPPRPRRRRGL